MHLRNCLLPPSVFIHPLVSLYSCLGADNHCSHTLSIVIPNEVRHTIDCQLSTDRIYFAQNQFIEKVFAKTTQASCIIDRYINNEYINFINTYIPNNFFHKDTIAFTVFNSRKSERLIGRQ